MWPGEWLARSGERTREGKSKGIHMLLNDLQLGSEAREKKQNKNILREILTRKQTDC